MPLSTRVSQVLLAALLFAAPSTARAEAGPVQRFLRGPYFPVAASTLRIVPPPGGHVMLHRDGKPVRWFMVPSAISVEPGIPYAVTAVRDDRVVFDSGIVARPGILDLAWSEADTPNVAYHSPVVANPFAVGLVPIGAASPAALRLPLGENGVSLMLDDLQLQPNDQARWVAFNRYAQQWLFTDAQIEAVVASFQWPMFRTSAWQLLQRRRSETR
jgi:hypothetical protein